MIKMLRFDDRLIHGQIAINWSKMMSIQMIVIANDGIAKDKTQVMVLKMAAPPGMKCSVLSIEDTIKNVTDPRAKNMAIMVITNNFPDTLAIVKGAKDEIERVNLGNNTIVDTHTTGMKALTQYVYVSESDIEICKELLTLGVPVDLQLRPELPYLSLEDALKQLK